jgi:hypothetical protein
MEQVKSTGIRIIQQLEEVIHLISDDDFILPVKFLGNSTIGQHYRHIIEFFECLRTGILSGHVNYDLRPRKNNLEINRTICLDALQNTAKFISELSHDGVLQLEAGFDTESDTQISIKSSILRELAFTIDHSVHHMALIKAGIGYILPEQNIDKDFGVAFSTLRHQKVITFGGALR